MNWLRTTTCLTTIAVASVAHARSINVDFTSTGAVPAPSYAAAGLAGAWNAINVLPPGDRKALVGLDGVASPVKIYQIGGSTMLNADDALTTGDDEALLDDMFLSFNDPLDECVWFEGLENGDYRVLIYAMRPTQASHQNRVRVDFATPGPTWIGGAWPGAHVEGITFQGFDVTVTDGTIGLHSGVPNGFIESGINGIQLIDLGEVTSAGLGSGATVAGSIRGVHPNPANGSQTIEFEAASISGAALEIVDVAGRVVWRSGALDGARGAVSWNGSNQSGRSVSAAVYFVRLIERGRGATGWHKILRMP